jgi:hypothetical protein
LSAIPLNPNVIMILVVACLWIGLVIPSWASFTGAALFVYLLMILGSLGSGGLSLSVGQAGRTGIKALSVYPIDAREAIRIQSKLSRIQLLLIVPVLVATAWVLLAMGGRVALSRIAISGTYAVVAILTLAPYLSLSALLGNLPIRGWGAKVLYLLVLLPVVIVAVGASLVIPGLIIAGIKHVDWPVIALVSQVVLPFLVVRYFLWLYFRHCDWVVRQSTTMPRVTVEFTDEKGRKEDARP